MPKTVRIETFKGLDIYVDLKRKKALDAAAAERKDETKTTQLGGAATQAALKDICKLQL